MSNAYCIRAVHIVDVSVFKGKAQKCPENLQNESDGTGAEHKNRMYALWAITVPMLWKSIINLEPSVPKIKSKKIQKSNSYKGSWHMWIIYSTLWTNI